MVKLDIRDRKLLYYLSKNSRQSHTKLASLVKIGKNTVSYKIDRFLKEGVIDNFSTVINTGALGVTTFTVLLKFNKDLQKNKEIIDFFTKHPFAEWVVLLSGNYDLFLEFVTTDINHFVALLKEIKEHFQADLNHYKVHLLEEALRVEHLVKDLYVDLGLEVIYPQKREYIPKKLDELDKKILSVLSKNSDKTLTEIAKEIGSTWDVVRYRIKQMEKDKIILKYFPQINLLKLGYLRFICELDLHNLDNEKFKKIRYIIKVNDNITYAFANSNSMSILLDCSFKSISDLDSFLSKLQEDFKENIININYNIVREELKFDLFPDGLLQS